MGSPVVKKLSKFEQLKTYSYMKSQRYMQNPLWLCGVAVITTARLNSTKPELKFCTGLNPAPGLSEICDNENL